jgi:5-(carboxyamino)imidazole ribonucleotide mutase
VSGDPAVEPAFAGGEPASESAFGGALDRAAAETVAAAAPEPTADALEDIPIDSPLVGIVMGSRSDLETMQAAARELDDRGISHETRVISAHREPDTVAEYARTARLRGLRVVIAGAGLSAALPGAIAAHTDLPVIGVPLTSRLTAAGGLDAILSITQMPPGVPVACVGLDNPRNAAVLAARILGAGGPPSAPGERPTAVG